MPDLQNNGGISDNLIKVSIKTLIMTNQKTPSIIVLQPEEPQVQPGVYRILPIWTGPAEAAQIGMALEKQRTPRPSTHDLFLDAITNLDAQVSHVTIVAAEKNTFFATLHLQQFERTIELDARPSDAIALALRQDAPIYVAKDVLEKASFPYIVKQKQSEEEEMAAFHSFLENLNPEDFQ